MKAKEYLLQIKKLDRLIENKLIEVEQWKSIAMGTTSNSEGERVQSSSNLKKMEDAVAKYVDIQNEINEYIDKLVDTKREILKTLETLSAIEYDVLHKIYVQDKTLDEVSEQYGKTYTWTTTVHGRALKNLQDIINLKEEN